MSRPDLAAVLRHARSLAAATGGPASDADLLGRFTADRDGDAFAALVGRHGPMVWGVCRNLLPDDADAEDAFQATFLVLARSAGAVRQRDRLAAWLHGVAVRVALKARRSAAHRRRRERAAARPEAADPAPAWEDLLAVVHEEVRRLPEALRSAFVLCGLEGVRQPDAAARLGCTPDALAARLSRARQKLLAGLTRRGIAPATAGALAAAGAATGTTAPPALLARAAGLARPLTSVSPSVLDLSQGVFDMTTRMKWLAAALLATAGLAATILSSASAQRPPDPAPGGAPPAAERGQRGGGLPGFAAAGPRGWEYKVTPNSLNRSDAEEVLNKLGADGWELCAVSDRGGLVFKRPRGPQGGTPGGGRGRTTGTGSSGSNSTGQPPNNNPFGSAGSGFGNLLAGGSVAGPGIPLSDGSSLTIGAGMNPAGQGSEVQILPLKNASAVELVRLLKEVFGRSAVVTADQRTNSLIVSANPDTFRTISALVARLDGPGSEPGSQPRK